MKAINTLAVAATLLAGTTGANAALIDRGGGMIYDSTRNITWLADMNYAKTSGFDADGLMNWSTATAWADNLVYGGYSDWRLPTLNPADTTCGGNFTPPGGGFPNQYLGTGCTGSELSGLFVTDLGSRANESVLIQVGDTAEQMANLALFSNVQPYDYWSVTEYAPFTDAAWHFRTDDGVQSYGFKSVTRYAVAVREGNVTVAVPEPQSLALAIAALAAGSLVRRRTQRFASSR